VGQTAASISHNLKNPLGSIKTILQLQLENPEMPDSMRAETKMLLEEIGRLSAKLNQLLHFSRPAVRGGSLGQWCDARTVLEQVSGVLRHEAEQRGVRLDLVADSKPVHVAMSPEILNDVVSNLVVNALEAAPRGGRVQLMADTNGSMCTVAVEDDGPGIPASAREKILQPFFTTKPQGTGLGLAIVARRVAEAGGALRWDSPLNEGRGARFEVSLRLANAKELKSSEQRTQTSKQETTKQMHEAEANEDHSDCR
jgi:signal transduction histidine kinase